MYSTLSLKRLVACLGLPPLLIFAAILLHRGTVPGLVEGIGLANKVVGGWSLFLVLFGSGSQWWRPWRLAWRIRPIQRLLFPDLNGVWRGTTRSNWPSIKAMKDAYEGLAAQGHAGPLDLLALQEDGIELTITASFFRLRAEGKLSATGGKSHTTSARVEWNNHLERFELSYVYVHNTPSPVRTDEAMHPGAAHLVLDMDADRLEGEYWTRRTWRSGLNTAGLIEVVRS
jgi:hypothetical protein